MAYLGITRSRDYLYHANEETIELARRMRRCPTSCEKLLWRNLKGKNLMGLHFRRQHPIEFFVADFYCHSIKLVIEVDGPVHDTEEQRIHDENRTAELDRLGIIVIRFTNHEIREKIPWVINRIKTAATQRINVK